MAFLFWYVVGLGSLFSLIISIVGFSSADNVDFITCLFSGIDILFSLGLVALACYIIYTFLYIRPNAVFLGEFSVLDMNTGLVDHNMLRMQPIRYITDPRLVWIFAALFSPEIGRACIISCFATTPVERMERVVNEMLQTIRFK